jgi:hypothetical protein
MEEVKPVTKAIRKSGRIGAGIEQSMQHITENKVKGGKMIKKNGVYVP